MAYSAEPRDLQDAGGRPRRYAAFISYNWGDERFARGLHRRLETYRLPRRLSARGGVAGSRLKPIFRDKDELAASHDLTEAVREAIAESDHLIVVCSPRAAASPWVAREIELFRALHGDASILTALADGPPADAFPAALRRTDGPEPLAADFRGDGADRRLALLKLIAALAGVRLDELIQRDAQRRMRSMALGAAASVAAVAVVAGLSVVAVDARRQAEAQQARAGSLGQFMVSDLRKSLESAGRHDVLAQVDQAAMKALSADPSRLTPDQLLQRATLLQGMATDAEKKGDLNAAQAAAQAALKTTATLLAAKPDDPKRLYAHAQSEYWIGFVAWREGDAGAARVSYEAYARLAGKLVQLDPNNPEWRREKAYAAGDLGSLALRQAGDPASAERYFQAALTELDAVGRRQPNDPDLAGERAKGLGWLADAQRQQGHLAEAKATRAEQREILSGLLKANARNVGVKAQLLFNDLALARISLAEGRTAEAVRLLEAGRKRAADLEAQDPDNKDFPKQARMFELFEVRAWLGLPSAKQPPAQKIAAVLGDCQVRGPGSDNLEISDFCNVLLARVRGDHGDLQGAAMAMDSVRQHAAAHRDILTARWGLNLADEARPVRLADIRGGTR